MIPKEFDYTAPQSIEEALAALRDGGEDARLLAGGHSLIPMMKLRLAAPSLLVDLRRIEGLRTVGAAGGQLEIGAMVTHHTLESSAELRAGCPLLGETAASIGDTQVRMRGTLGGSLAHADPAADLTAAVLALDGALVVAGMNGGAGRREIPAGGFFSELFTTSLQPGEILTSIRVPRQQPRTGSAYVKIRNKASHYALAGAAAVLTLAEDGTCSHAAVALTGVAAVPFRLERLEQALRGGRLDDGDLQGVDGMINELDVAWLSDLQGSEDYRRHLAAVVTRRALEAARSKIAR